MSQIPTTDAQAIILTFIDSVAQNVVNSGDETRDCGEKEIAKKIIKRSACSISPKAGSVKKTHWWRRNVVSVDTAYVYVYYLNYRLTMFHTNERSIRELMEDWDAACQRVDPEFVSGEVWYSFNGRPLRPNATLRDYDVFPGARIQANVRLRGGAQSKILLPTYSIVAECESEVMEQCVFQTVQSLAFLSECSQKLVSTYCGMDIPDIVEDFLCLIVALIDARRWRTVYIAVSQFLKKYIRVEGSFFAFLLEKIKGMFPNSLQSGTNFDAGLVENFVANFKQFRDSEASKKLYRTIMYIFSLASYGSDMNDIKFNMTYECMFKMIYKKGSDFVTVFLDGLIFLCKRGYQCYVTGSLSPIWHHEDEYTQFIDDTMECKRNVTLMSDPETHGLNIFAFQAKVESLIEKGEAMVKFGYSDSKAERAYLARAVNDLKMIRSELTTKQAAQKSRPAPFSLLIFGGSSMGKSNFTQILFQHFGKVFDLPIESEFLYTRNAVDQYWSGFTSIQWGVILDDIGFMKPSAAPQGDPSLLEMLQVVNNVPYNPNQAELEMKGRTPLRCKLVLATSNTEDLNAFAYFACPLAVRRRLPYVIELKPKPEYSSNGTMLDPDLVPANTEQYPDLWLITVKKVVPADDNRARLEKIACYSDINEFLAWYGQTAKKFDQIQKRALEAVSLTKALSVCKECCYEERRCVCNKLQSGHSAVGVLTYIFKRPYIVRWLYFLYTFGVFRNLLLWICTKLDRPEVHSTAMVLMGRRRFSSFKPPTHLKAFLAFASAASMLYLCSLFFYKEDEISKSLKTAELQGVSQSQEPQAKGTEKVNAWYNEELELASSDIGRASLSLVGKEEMAEDIIGRNVVYVEVKCLNGNNKVNYQNALCIRGNVYVANNHLFAEEGDYEIRIMSNAHRQGIDTKVKYVLNSKSFDRRPDRDLVFFQIKSVPPKKDITKYIARSLIKGKFDGTMISLLNGVQVKRHVRAISVRPVNVQQLERNFEMYVGHTDKNTQYGDCGGPLVISSHYGPVLAGIHTVGSQGVAGSVTILQSDVENLAFEAEIQSGSIKLSAQGLDVGLGPLHTKSVFRYIEKGNAQVFGSLTNTNRSSKSSDVVKTIFYDDVRKLGYEDKCRGPPLSGWVPWRHAALEMVDIANDFNATIVDTVKQQFSKEILAHLKGLPEAEVNLDDVFPYGLDVALNGMPGVAFVDKLNRKTSAGFPWKTSKKKFLVPRDCETHPDCIGLTHELNDRVWTIVGKYRLGERHHPVFCGNLKDEPLPLEKCEAGKTRVFAGAPVDWTIVVRIYYLSLIRLIQNHQHFFECSVGIAAQTRAWNDLRKYLTQFGEDRIFAGDYSKYDKKMSPTFILAAFEILIDIAKASGKYDEGDLRVMWGIAYDTAFPVMDFNGDLVEFFGSNPSGHPLTVIINSLVNSLYMRYCYYVQNPKKEVESFKKNVALMTYGDDNVAGVNRECDFFNHTVVQNTLARVGVKYTMADKESQSVPFIHINDVEFLKRKWRWEAELESYVCPLAEASIHKMLTRTVKSKVVSDRMQAASILDTACREYFWYGRGVFEQKRKEFMDIYANHRLEIYGWEGIFPDWVTLCRQYLESSNWSLARDQEEIPQTEIADF
jgi:hypothetical protein